MVYVATDSLLLLLLRSRVGVRHGRRYDFFCALGTKLEVVLRLRRALTKKQVEL